MHTQSIRNFFKNEGRGYLVIFGAAFVQLTLGTVFTIGNLSPYVTSYIRQHGDPNATNNLNVWIDAIVICAAGLVMPLGGIIEGRLGPQMTGLIGSAIMSCGTALTYFTIKHSYPIVLLTYGAMFGFGFGTAYISMMAVGIRWFPNHRGAVNGIILGSFSLGSFAFTLVQTAFVNPNNVSPGKDGYFVDETVLNRLPYLFLLLAGIYIVMQITGCLLLKNPPKQTLEENVEEFSLSPKEALKTKEFYMLWFTMLLNVQTVTFFNSMYKTFGQTFIGDDRFLALVGSFCAVSNTLGRIGYGFLIDRYKYKKCMAFLSTYVIVFVLTIQLTPNWNKIMFAIWSNSLFLGVSGSYTLICTCVSNTFGSKHAGTIYGMVFANAVVGGPITAVTTQYLLPIIGFNGMFYLLAGLLFIGLIITALFNDRSLATERSTVVVEMNNLE